jgi:hypothetical protein
LDVCAKVDDGGWPGTASLELDIAVALERDFRGAFEGPGAALPLSGPLAAGSTTRRRATRVSACVA